MSSSRERKEDIIVPLLSSFANLVSGDAMLRNSERGVIGNFACTFFGKGKWTFFRKVKCTS